MNIAIVGAGISGISAAYNLQKHHQVTLIEKNKKLGGHSNTIHVKDDNGDDLFIDTGFIVMNHKNYPNFSNFLKNLNVPLIKSDMSFSYFNKNTNIQYAGTLKGLLPNLWKIFSPNHYRLLYLITKYSKILDHDYQSGKLNSSNFTIKEYLEKIQCPEFVMKNYFFPIAGAIWSCPQEEIEQYPVTSYVKFFHNHGLLRIGKREQWYTISGGSKEYIKKFETGFNGTIIKDTKVINIRQTDNKVLLNGEHNYIQEFDLIIMATHADETLSMLNSPTQDQQKILSAFKYSKNQIVLHTDSNVLSKNKNIWASWNFITSHESIDPSKESIHYYMNRLQKIKSKKEYIVSVNPPDSLKKETIIYTTEYTHPILGQDAIKMQSTLLHLNKQSRILFCGSYFGFGFHEDGYLSGLNVSKEILKRF